MSTDYEKVYKEQRHALGKPTQSFLDFFDQYDLQAVDVLDVGCGQGRDSLFIARQGHRVVGVDISPSGLDQLLEEAQAEGLNVEGVVADLRNFEPTDAYDLVVIDRTLHMLAESVRIDVLARVSGVTREGGYVLIADEKSNLPAMRLFFEKDSHDWATIKDKKGFLFMQKMIATR